MSGGVDSSVAAALLGREGYECTGVFMCLGQAEKTAGAHAGCCSPEDAQDARTVADRLGIGFHVLNFQRDLQQIIDYFIDEYRHARTPNPCIECNRRLKFGKLMDYARLINADYVATGHYARIVSSESGPRLCRALDSAKDQSYALFSIGRESLSRVLFPVGEHAKDSVRGLARQFNLPVHDKGESQEICFVPDDDYAGLIAARAPELVRKGLVVNTAGETLGEHEGIFRYTIGQRRGLGIALGEPAYVVALDAESNTVVLGSREELLKQTLWADRVSWLTDVPSGPFPAMVQIRYNHRGARATVTPLSDDDVVGVRGVGDGTSSSADRASACGSASRVRVDFQEPVAAITPGQAAVFYDEQQCVVGGGWIVDGHPPG